MAPRADLFAKLVLIGLALCAAFGLGWWFLGPRSAYETEVGVMVDQPVPFSHQHHVNGLGLDCRMCHTGVETGAVAGFPPVHTCMTCHSQIWTNAKVLAPVRDSLASGQPLHWRRVNVLPDYVYFNHAVHIAKGVDCAQCHGAVETMPMLAKAHGFTMDFCLSCHRAQQARFPNRDLTDCSICHR